jgi:nicotinamide-nucleotide amidase
VAQNLQLKKNNRNIIMPPDLVHEIASLLMAHHWQLVTAESCTGGLIASCLTDVPGSSAWFDRGFITYSNASKQDLLDVPQELIVRYGAVSEEVAKAMAVGALKHSAAHIALSVTGIAGPGGGSIEKPVGTVWLAWIAKGTPPQALEKHYSGTRQEIRATACQDALKGVVSLLK